MIILEIVDYKQLFKSALVYIIYSNSYIFKYIPIIIFGLFGIYYEDTKFALLISLIVNIILLFVLLKIYWKDLKKEFKIFIDNILDNIDIGLLYWLIGLTIMVISNLILTYVFKSKGANNEIIIQSYIKPFPVIMGINICITAPFIEELVFRKTLHDSFKNKYVFIVLSFLIFGLAHVMQDAKTIIDWLYIIPYGSLGACFAIMYSKTKTVFTSMTIHMIHNTTLFFISLVI